MVLRVNKSQLLNVLLRLLPLGAKLLLTLYMGRYFSLADMGVYGLVFGSVMILQTFLGQDFGYVVGRDIVHVPALTALHKMRDQGLLYAANYVVLIIAAFALVQSGLTDIPPRIICYTVILTILEGYAGAVHANMNSLNQQLRANTLFFVRAGIWVIPAVFLGLFNNAWRTVDTVLICWIVGEIASVGIIMWFWRGMPWREALRLPVDRTWLISGLKKCGLIWIGTLGLSAGTYVDRFVVEHDLSLDDVGVVTFYFSFASALLTLMQSGVLAFTYPRLIALHRDGHTPKFMREARQSIWQVALGAGVVAVALGIIVPVLGLATGRQALVNSALTLWLMLFGTWIRANAEALNYILYARHQDRAIWLGNLLFLIPAFGGNALLVPIVGLPGIGYAAILAGVFLFLWRWKHVGSLKS